MSKIVPVRFKGANYMCVEDSPRAKFLSQANTLWLTGDRDQWRDVFNMALTSSGCAFEHRAMTRRVGEELPPELERISTGCMRQLVGERLGEAPVLGRRRLSSRRRAGTRSPSSPFGRLRPPHSN